MTPDLNIIRKIRTARYMKRAVLVIIGILIVVIVLFSDRVHYISDKTTATLGNNPFMAVHLNAGPEKLGLLSEQIGHEITDETSFGANLSGDWQESNQREPASFEYSYRNWYSLLPNHLGEITFFNNQQIPLSLHNIFKFNDKIRIFNVPASGPLFLESYPQSTFMAIRGSNPLINDRFQSQLQPIFELLDALDPEASTLLSGLVNGENELLLLESPESLNFVIIFKAEIDPRELENLVKSLYFVKNPTEKLMKLDDGTYVNEIRIYDQTSDTQSWPLEKGIILGQEGSYGARTPKYTYLSNDLSALRAVIEGTSEFISPKVLHSRPSAFLNPAHLNLPDSNPFKKLLMKSRLIILSEFGYIDIY